MRFKTYIASRNLVNALTEEAQQYAKEWLTAEFGYRYFSGGVEAPRPEIIKDLLDNYPFDGNAIYMGINFLNQQAYDEFLVETHNGTKFASQKFTRWTASVSVANKFATDRGQDVWSGAADSAKTKNKDHMDGIAGLVIKAAVKPSDVIQIPDSATRKQFVALLPGTYDTVIDEEHLPFMKSIDTSNYKSEFMSVSSLSRDESNKKELTKFEHILFHYKEFDNEMSKHLGDLLRAALNDISYEVTVVWTPDYTNSSHTKHGKAAMTPHIEMAWNVPSTFLYYFDLLLPNDEDELEQKISDTLMDIDREFREKTVDVDWVHTAFQMQVYGSLLDTAKSPRFADKVKFLKHLQSKIGLAYNQLNSYEATKRINSIEDPDQKRDAIKSLTKRIENALGHMKLLK